METTGHTRRAAVIHIYAALARANAAAREPGAVYGLNASQRLAKPPVENVATMRFVATLITETELLMKQHFPSAASTYAPSGLIARPYGFGTRSAAPTFLLASVTW